MTFLLAASLAAADQQRLALESKAQADFDRVQKSRTPQLRDATTCIQSQAALLPRVGRELLPVLYYRKGYCTIASAVITGQTREFAAAAGQFEKAIESWPLRIPKSQRPEPIPSALRALAAIAALQTVPDEAGLEQAASAISSAVAASECSSMVLEAGFCNAVLRAGRQWLGWIALRNGNIEAAVRELADAAEPGWTAWAAGRKAFRDRNYKEAARQYRIAVETWNRAKEGDGMSLVERLGPDPGLPAKYSDLGAAQLLAGELQAAIASLSKVADARTLFLRARARELAGQTNAALGDYNLASRTAFAGASDLASGEAHLYRGIAQYRRKDYTRAEHEFSSALNFQIPEALRADAAAWRHMAAVAGGSCGASLVNLERALTVASLYFPKDEARALLISCPISTISTAGARL